MTSDRFERRVGGASRPLFSALCFALLLTGACQAPTHADAPDPQPQDWSLTAHETASPALAPCDANRLLIAPDGKAAAVWSEPFGYVFDASDYRGGFDYVQIVTAPGNDPARRARSFLARSIDKRLQPLMWSSDGSQLQALWGNTTLVRLSGTSPAVTRGERIDRMWARTRISTAGHGDAAALMAAARGRLGNLAPLEGETRVLATFASSEVRFATVANSAGTVVIAQNGQPRRTDLPALLVRNPILAREEGRLLLRDVAYGNAGGGGDRGYRRPIVDLESGRFVGSFGLRTIALDNRLAQESARLLDELPEPYLLADVSVSGESMAVLFSDLKGEVSLAFVGDHGSSIVNVCDHEQQEAARRFSSRGGPSPWRNVVDFLDGQEDIGGTSDDPFRRRVSEIEFAEQGEGRSAAFGTLFSSPESLRHDLVVSFHGGPAQSALDGDITEIVRRLRLPRADVLIFEYSGSAGGPGLFQRLREEGAAAIERDIDALARWISEKGYRRVHLVGTSFGSVPVLAALAHPSLDLCSVNLVAPLLRWQETRELAEGRGADTEAFAMRRSSFERAVFGDEEAVDRFRTWLGERLPLVSDPRVRIHFASRDRGSTPGHLPPGAASGDRIAIVPGPHAAVMGPETVWSALRDDVAGSCGGA